MQPYIFQQGGEGRYGFGMCRHLIIPPQWGVIMRVRKVLVHFNEGRYGACGGGIRGGVSRERRVEHSREGRAWVGLCRHLINPPQWVVITRVRKVAVHFHFNLSRILCCVAVCWCLVGGGGGRKILTAPECRYCQCGGHAVGTFHTFHDACVVVAVLLQQEHMHHENSTTSSSNTTK